METGKNPQNKALTTGQIAQHCHVTHRAVLKWVASGKLKAYRTPGMHSRVNVQDFLEFLQKYQIPVPAEFNSTPVIKKVLIVDDDRGMVHSIQRALVLENKYIIETAFDGFEAGKKFATFKPDFMVMDIRMPGMDGYQVCTSIRKDAQNNHIKILAISALNDPQEVKKILELGANDYIEKPFGNETLVRKIEQMLR